MRVSELRVSDPEKKRPCQLFLRGCFQVQLRYQSFRVLAAAVHSQSKSALQISFLRNRVKLCPWNNHSRKGHIYLFIPRHNLDRLAVNVNGKRSTFDVVANTPGSDTSGGKLCIGRIISIPVVVRGDGSDMNGEVLVTF
jgi:hypothetical protein